jgi:hypothetical protein
MPILAGGGGRVKRKTREGQRKFRNFSLRKDLTRGRKVGRIVHVGEIGGVPVLDAGLPLSFFRANNGRQTERRRMKTAHGRTGVTMNLTPDAKHGVVTQDPVSTLATMNGMADVLADMEIGVPYVIRVRIGSGSFVAAATDYVVDVFAKDCPHKLRILEASFVMQAITTTDWDNSDGGVLDLQIEHGDGAASESLNDILAVQLLDENYAVDDGTYYPNGTINLDQTYCVIGVDESLKVTLGCDPDATITTGASACWVDVIFTVMRVN